MEVKIKKVLKIMGFVVLGIVVAIAFGFVVQGLWNWLMPEIFNLKKITYWQGVGIVILAKILFGGFGSSSSSSTSKNKQEKCTKDTIVTTTDNVSQDELYDQWWAEEGENKFEAFMNKK